MTQNHVFVFRMCFITHIVFSGGGFSELELWILQLSVGVKASLVESQEMSSSPLITFHCFSCCIHFAFMSLRVSFIFLSCCIYFCDFAFISLNVPVMLHSFLFIFHSFPVMFVSFCIHFIFRHYVSCRASKGDMLKAVRWVSAQTFFICNCL